MLAVVKDATINMARLLTPVGKFKVKLEHKGVIPVIESINLENE